MDKTEGSKTDGNIHKENCVEMLNSEKRYHISKKRAKLRHWRYFTSHYYETEHDFTKG